MSESVPDGWDTWHTDPGGISVWVFRPDVFDGDAFPPACIPTLTIKPARERGPRGRPGQSASEWWSELRLEPDVLLERRTAGTREQAMTLAIQRATAFTDGDIAFRTAYADPPVDYLDRLESIIDDQ